MQRGKGNIKPDNNEGTSANKGAGNFFAATPTSANS